MVTRQGRTCENFQIKKYSFLPENVFNTTEAEENVNTVTYVGMEEAECIDQAIFAANNCAEDIDFIQNQGLQVDNDNEPVLENIPLPNQTQNHNQLNE